MNLVKIFFHARFANIKKQKVAKKKTELYKRKIKLTPEKHILTYQPDKV